MSLSPSVTFNKSTLNVDGLNDLGKYTPERQENELGDHALVFMYQPYQGPWIQAIGAFLSKGAAPQLSSCLCTSNTYAHYIPPSLLSNSN